MHDKRDGPCTSLGLTLPCTIDRGVPWVNPMHYPDGQTTGTGDNDNMTLLRSECFATRAIRATTGLLIEGEERDILQKICEENRTGFQENAVIKATAELQKTRGKSVRTSEWSTRDGLLHFRDRVYVPKNPDLRRCITSQHHDTKMT